MELSGYRFMWVFVMFDLPTETKADKKHYAQFRKHLLKDGFVMMQFSVYVRHCASEENADVHTARVDMYVPPEGEVRVLRITDKQYERMAVFWGKKRKPPEKPPAQLELF
jgi:CRISPR-associated protein Cas2